MLAGKGATVHFTSLSESSASSLASRLGATPQHDGSTLAKVNPTTSSILVLMKEHNIPLHRVCLLDPKAEAELAPQDGEGTFDMFLFGVRFLRSNIQIADE